MLKKITLIRVCVEEVFRRRGLRYRGGAENRNSSCVQCSNSYTLADQNEGTRQCKQMEAIEEVEVRID